MELIAKIGFFLAVAMLIGVGVGWFVSDILKKKSTLIEAKSLRSTIHTRDKQLKILEESLSLQKTQLYKMTDEGIVNRHKLLKQSNMLRKQADELFMIQDKLGEIKAMEKDKENCLKSVVELSLQLKEMDDILDIYEKEILLSKNVQEESASLDNREIEELKNKIKSLEESLTNSQPKLSDSDMVISKDQFTHIEKEFEEFKEKISTLENEKEILMLAQKDKSKPTVREKIGKIFSVKKSKTHKYVDLNSKKQPKVKQV